MTACWFETHAHLSDARFDEDRDNVVKAALEKTVGGIVEIADGPDEWPKARTLAERFSRKMWWAAGLHPYYAEESSPTLWENLKREARHPQFVAIGEIGLDYAKSTVTPDRQKSAFLSGLDLALEIDKPVVIHCRNAFPDVRKILRERYTRGAASKPPGVIHCFTGTREDAEDLLALGFFLGVDGPVTYPSSKDLRETLISVPVERLVLETDSPYLPPQPLRGKRNDPRTLEITGSHLASLLQLTPQKLAEITTRNSYSLFHLNSN